MHIDADFIAQVIASAQFYNHPFLGQADFNVDSRTIAPGEIFVALQGEKVDGHDYIGQALERGATGFILALSCKDAVLQKYQHQLEKCSVVFVHDTLQALTQLAYAWRSKFTFPVVGITGTVGKTTTKEMVRNILKLTSHNPVISFGNQNTLIGASLNILKMRPYHTVAIFELGISQKGSMKKLVDLVRPTYCLITRVGHGHMQGLGDLNSIAKEKRDIFALFGEQDIGIVNGDQAELTNISYRHPVILFGKKTTNQIQARKIVSALNTISFTVKIYNKKYSVVLPTCSQARVMNALAAIAIGYLLKIPDEILVQGVQMPLAVEGRFQLIQLTSGAEIINDAYNANPESVKASLLAFDQYVSPKSKIVVLGDMLELGDSSSFWHRQIGRFLRKVTDLKIVVLIGKESEWTKKTVPYGIKVLWFKDTHEAYETIHSMALNSDNVMLFKASRSMRFIEMIQKLQS